MKREVATLYSLLPREEKLRFTRPLVAAVRENVRRRREALLETLRNASPAEYPRLAEVRRLCAALEELRAVRPLAAEAAELHYFCRLGPRMVAITTDRSEEAGVRDLRFARAWLTRALRRAQPAQ